MLAAVRLRERGLRIEPTVPITVTPSDFSHCEAISPTPPAAACHSTVMPGCTLNVRLMRYWAVMPFSIIAAAVSNEMPSGIFTARSAG